MSGFGAESPKVLKKEVILMLVLEELLQELVPYRQKLKEMGDSL